jgi:hypothetical protein
LQPTKTFPVFLKYHWKLAKYPVRPMLAAYQNFSRFSLISLKIGQISCFGKSRAFQPAKHFYFISFFTISVY